MSALQTPTARAIIYFCCIGGLLVLNALIVMVLWNEVFLDLSDTDRRLTFLEGAGLTAFAYVGAFSVRYAVQARQQTTGKTSSEALRTKCSQMSPEDKAKLKAELVANCGCAERAAPSPNGTSTIHRTV